MSKSETSVELELGPNKITLLSVPFKLEVSANGETYISLNERGLLRFEHTRVKP